MTEITRLILFTDTEGQDRSETTIYVEDIGEFIQWWISTPPRDMKVDVPGEFVDIDIRYKMGKELLEVATT